MDGPTLWQRLSQAVAACPEAQVTEFCESLVVELDRSMQHTARAAWQASCVVAAVLDALPISPFARARLHALARRVLTAADTCATSAQTTDMGAGSAASSDDHAARTAAAAVLWRSGSALCYACAEAHDVSRLRDAERDGQGQRCVSLHAARQFLYAGTSGTTDESDGAHAHGTTHSAHASAAMLTATRAVLHSARTAHAELAIESAAAGQVAVDSATARLVERDTDRGTDATTSGSSSDAQGREQQRKRKHLRREMKLLVAAELLPTPTDLAAGDASRIAACVSRAPHAVSVAHWADVCEHAGLLDAHAPSAALRRWLGMLWDSLGSITDEARPPCLGDASASSAVARPVMPPSETSTLTRATSASVGLLRSASFFELPRIRSLLLSSAWHWVQQQLPEASDAAGKLSQPRLEFVLLPALSRPSHAAPPSDGDGVSASSLPDYAYLIGAPCTGKPLRLSAGAWMGIARLLDLLSQLPHEWVPSEDVEWLLPATLVLAQLAHAGLDAPESQRVKARLAAARTAQATALAACIRLAAAYACACPVAALGAIPDKALRRVLQWCVRLPPLLQHAQWGIRRSSHAARVAQEVAVQCASLVRALSSCALAMRPPAAAAPLFPRGYLRWVEALHEGLHNPLPATTAHLASMAALVAHLAAITEALPFVQQPHQRSARAQPTEAVNAGGGEASEALVMPTEAAEGARRKAQTDAIAAWLLQLRGGLLAAESPADAANGPGGSPVPPLFTLFDAPTADGVDATSVRALTLLFECQALWLRCYATLRRDSSAAVAPPPRLCPAIECALRVLRGSSPPPPPPGLRGDGTDVATLHPCLRDAALGLISALSVWPDLLHAALPIANRRTLIVLLIALLQPTSARVLLTPSARVRPSDAHTPLGILRRFLTTVDVTTDDDGDRGDGNADLGDHSDGNTDLERTLWRGTEQSLLGWLMQHLLGELAYAHVLPPAQVRATILGLTIISAASSPIHLAAIHSARAELLRKIVAAATQIAPSLADAADADSVRTAALYALTALCTNDQVRLETSDGVSLLRAAGSVVERLELRVAPPPAAVPSARAFQASHFLLVALLRQRSRLVYAAAPLLLSAVRGLLLALAHAPPTADDTDEQDAPSLPLECVRSLRRLLELLALHRKALVRHCSYLLADIVGVCRVRRLPAVSQHELLPGIHALLGMCTEVEVQAVHSASDPDGQRVLKDLLDSYATQFKRGGGGT